MSRLMFDAAVLPSELPEGAVAAGGYLAGGQVYRPWTAADWAEVKAWGVNWLLPIRVADPGADGHAAAVETVRDAEQLGCPRGVCLALDVEQNMAEHAARGFAPTWAHFVAGSGFVPLIYTSASAQPVLAAGLGGVPVRWWLADWTGEPHELAGAAAVQYTSPSVDPSLDVDLSTVIDGLPLWPIGTEHPGGTPVPPTLNAPVVAIVHSPVGGYWLVAEDGGVFAFGAAQAFPHDPYPSEHLNAPIVGAACNAQGTGLWLAGADGGVFTLGAAEYHGSIPEQLGAQAEQPPKRRR